MTYAVPHRIETERLVIRRYVAEDAEQLAAVVTKNVDHLRRFMEWIKFEPQSVEQRREFIADVGRKFDTGEDYALGMFDTGGTLLGGTGFHVFHPPSRLETGYWIDQAHEGRGLVTEACAALTQVGLQIAGARIVGISHAPDNVRSASIPQRLGYTRQEAPAHPCIDSGIKVPGVTWWATYDTLAREPLASTPRPRVFDEHGALIAWPH